MHKYPMIAPKHITEFTDAEYKEYMEEIYLDPRANKPKPKEVVITKSIRGAIAFRIKRDPKFVTKAELESAALEIDTPIEELIKLASKRGIKIEDGKTHTN